MLSKEIQVPHQNAFKVAQSGGGGWSLVLGLLVCRPGALVTYIQATGTCVQVWQLELDPWIPQGSKVAGENPVLKAVHEPSLPCHTNACTTNKLVPWRRGSPYQPPCYQLGLPDPERHFVSSFQILTRARYFLVLWSSPFLYSPTPPPPTTWLLVHHVTDLHPGWPHSNSISSLLHSTPRTCW